MLGLITQGIGYGFSAGTSPGPLQSFLINLTLREGWRKSIAVIFAPLISDGPIILLMTFLLKDLPPEVRRLLQIGGGLFVLYIAWGAWKGFRAQSSTPVSTTEDADKNERTPLVKAVMMNFLSPGPYIFWGTITGPLLITGLEESLLHGGAFLLAFYGTFLGILALWVAVFDRLRRVDERVTRGILLVTIGVLVSLGVSLIWQGIGINVEAPVQCQIASECLSNN